MSDPVAGPVEQETARLLVEKLKRANRFAVMVSVTDNEMGENIVNFAFNCSHSIYVERRLREAADKLEARAEEQGYD